MSSDRMHDLHVFMAQVSEEMASEYQRIFVKTAEDPGTAGDEGEQNWAKFLEDWLPSGYHVRTKGRVISENGSLSPQIDVLILKPSYPKKLLDKRVWLAGGVAAVFECKNTLKAEHIRDSVDRCKKFKSVVAKRTGTPYRELRSGMLYGILSHSHAWKSSNSEPAENIQKALEKYSDERVDHPSDLIDFVCVADIGTWSVPLTVGYRSEWLGPEETDLKAIFGGTWGVSSAFLANHNRGERQLEYFKPVSALLSQLTQALAREDPTLRDIADYYRRANMGGNGLGNMRFWPPTVLSPEVQTQIAAGRLKANRSWDEWSMALF